MLALFALVTLGHADPQRVLARRGEPLTERTWWTVEDLETGPARPKWRNRRGTWTCWTFPDGVAARCVQHDKKTRAVLADWRFDAGGVPLTTTVFQDGAPVEVVVHGLDELTVDVGAREHTDIGPVRVFAATAPSVDPNGIARATLPQGRLTVQVVDSDRDVLDDAFGRALRARCACILEDRASAWLLEHGGVRYRLRFPDPEAPTVSELWAVPFEDQTVLASFSVDATGSLRDIQARLDHGRAWMALIAPAPDPAQEDPP